MSLADCLNIETPATNSARIPATTDTVETQPMYGGVAQLPTGEAIVDAKAAQDEWTDTIAENGLNSNLPFIRDLDSLEAMRKHWEVTEMAASHARLYAILTGIYSYYYNMKDKATTTKVREMMKSALDSFTNRHKSVTSADTHDMNRVVKAVFGDNRRRVSAYAIALRHAYDYGVRPENLAAWIKGKGGVEEARKEASKSGMPRKERVEIAEKIVKRATIDVIKTDKMTNLFSADDSEKMVLLVATYRATGELEIQCVVKTDSAVKAALAAYYSTNKEDIRAAAASAEIAAHTPMATAQSI